MTRIHCELGDITRVEVDAIVNAANPALRGGGGVDGAIHRAAGPEMLAELIDRYPGGCPTGQARITHGYKLPTDWVVHTPGPVWHGGHQGEPELLASCHREALKLAAAHRCRTLAFPAISCGIFGYPLELAADVAVSTLQAECEHYQDIEDIHFVLFDEAALVAFGARLGAG